MVSHPKYHALAHSGNAHRYGIQVRVRFMGSSQSDPNAGVMLPQPAFARKRREDVGRACLPDGLFT